MGLKSLIERLKHAEVDTPDTSGKNMGYQRKAPIHAACTPDTPDTPHFVDTRAIVQTGQDEPAAPPIERAPNGNRIGKPFLSDDLQVLARAYCAHHAHCSICQAAGRGTGYGLRCGVGAALWCSYQDSDLIQQKRNTR